MSLAGSRRWTPEEAARFEIELCRGLANDKKAQRVYFAKQFVSKPINSGRLAKLITFCKRIAFSKCIAFYKRIVYYEQCFVSVLPNARSLQLL